MPFAIKRKPLYIKTLRSCTNSRSMQTCEEKLPPERQKIAGILCVFQDFLTQPGGNLGRKDVCWGLLVQLLTLFSAKRNSIKTAASTVFCGEWPKTPSTVKYSLCRKHTIRIAAQIKIRIILYMRLYCIFSSETCFDIKRPLFHLKKDRSWEHMLRPFFSILYQSEHTRQVFPAKMAPTYFP